MTAATRLVWTVLWAHSCNGWVPPQTALRKSTSSQSLLLRAAPVDLTLSSTTRWLDLSAPSFSSSLLVAEESWRQYVVLAVCILVLVDVLLGSPFMNAVLSPLQEATGVDTKSQSSSGSLFGALLGGQKETTASTTTTSTTAGKERVDSEKIAQEAMDRAQNLLDNLEWLEKSKTDYDRMEDLKRQMDKQMNEVDRTLEERSKQLEQD